MTTWMIEGHWSGPVNPAGNWTRVVHREFTSSRKRADAYRDLGSILYDDGTTLTLHVTQRTRGGKRPPAIFGYTELIRDCLLHGVRSVAELSATRTQP